MGRRLKLHRDLEEIPGLAYDPILNAPAVYFQPPSSVQMIYPCIRYKKDGGRIRHADNGSYHGWQKYLLTVIDIDPDSAIPEEVMKLSGVSYVTDYPANGLYHTTLSIYR